MWRLGLFASSTVLRVREQGTEEGQGTVPEGREAFWETN